MVLGIGFPKFPPALISTWNTFFIEYYQQVTFADVQADIRS